MELYADPGLYDSLFPNSRDSAGIRDEGRRRRTLDSEQFYLEEARKAGGRVLELACGSGRLTVPLALAGVDIAGADLSREMLAAAGEKARSAGVQIPFYEADMRGFALPCDPFAAVLIPGNSLLHLLTGDEWRRCFAGVRQHLIPSGRLVFDVSLFRAIEGPRTLTAPGCSIEESAVDEGQVRHFTWRVSDGRAIEFSLRVVTPGELESTLAESGFRLDERYGEFPRAPFEAATSPRQVCVCSCYS